MSIKYEVGKKKKDEKERMSGARIKGNSPGRETASSCS